MLTVSFFSALRRESGLINVADVNGCTSFRIVKHVVYTIARWSASVTSPTGGPYCFCHRTDKIPHRHTDTHRHTHHTDLETTPAKNMLHDSLHIALAYQEAPVSLRFPRVAAEISQPVRGRRCCTQILDERGGNISVRRGSSTRSWGRGGGGEGGGGEFSGPERVRTCGQYSALFVVNRSAGCVFARMRSSSPRPQTACQMTCTNVLHNVLVYSTNHDRCSITTTDKCL